MSRLGSTAARLKLKGIDGGPHKQRSVWFNSMQREEPYLGLTWSCTRGNALSGSSGGSTGAAWLSSARAVRCWVKSPNERNPCRWLYFSSETAARNAEEGGDDVKSARPLRPGRHTRYNGRYRRQRNRKAEQIPKAGPSSDCSLQLDYMKMELLVMASQQHRREYVLGSCTHRPSRHESRFRPKCVCNPQGRRRPKVRLVIGTKS